MAAILDGKLLAGKIENKLRQLINTNNINPGLTVIQAGRDQPSNMYVTMKQKACQRIGISFRSVNLPANADEAEVLGVIEILNKDDNTDGILVQLPLPAHIDVEKVSESLSPAKDVDCFHSYNIGRLFLGKPGFTPCTPLGCQVLLKHYNIQLEGKKAVIIGRSNIVGKPMALLFLQGNATVTVCHSYTENIEQEIGQADIVAVAIGKANFVKGEYLKPGAIVIDFGQHRSDSGIITGDVDYQSAISRASWITPVPGGTGPMTVATVLYNTVKAFTQRRQINFDGLLDIFKNI